MKEIIQNNNGFDLPENYFDELKSEVMLKVQKNQFEGGFTVPDNYIETLRKNVLANTKPDIKTIKISWFYYASAAAALLLAVTFIFLFEPQKQENFGSISDKEIINHLEHNGLSIDLLCDAGWCNEIIIEPNTKLENYLIDEMDETNFYDEL
ncbi:MAG: hypothetical protein ACK4K9_11325 [Bacteroidia bacterium]